jgi:tRNA G18 (ribose-2'-O)-methylase SpoU
VAELIEVSDASDPRLADYVSLRDVQLRQSLEAEHGFFIAEGEKVVRRAVAAGYEPRSFLMSRRWLDGLRDELDGAGDVPCYVVTDDLAEEVTGFHVHRGALASVRRRPLPSSPGHVESWSWRTSSTTPTSGQSSDAPPRLASTACSYRRAAPTRSTGGR